MNFSDQTKGLLKSYFKHRIALPLAPEAFTEARQYVGEWWPHVTRTQTTPRDTLIGVPKPYIVPSYDPAGTFDYEELYYWDSYFIAQGLLDQEHKELVLGILEDLMYLFEQYKVIPNASRTYLMGRSQPPFLSSFIFDAYDTFKLSKAWLQRAIAVAQAEYETVWMGVKKPNARQVYRGLSRYYDINMLHDLAEAESGWDMTPRFNRHALNYLPVDLNALLYKYEADFARAARIAGDDAAMQQWEERAAARVLIMNELMWSKARGLYYDYDYTRLKRGLINSLAAFVPMWAGMVTKEQAATLVRWLPHFEFKGGLATTDAQHLFDRLNDHLPMQWAFPNGWAPLHFLVVKALERYGYHAEAARIAHKWLQTNLAWFNQHHEFLEKYNVVNPLKLPHQGVYPTQTGFGWTNAIFERFCRDYVDTAR